MFGEEIGVINFVAKTSSILSKNRRYFRRKYFQNCNLNPRIQLKKLNFGATVMQNGFVGGRLSGMFT
jgi:hypothetical protein